MKKTILLIAAILSFALTTKSQITLENIYSKGYATLANLTTGGYKYYVLDKSANQIIVYNTNHSIFKTINITPPSGTYMYSYPSYLSDNLFSTDNLIEFGITYYNTNPPFDSRTIIYNELNTVLLTLNNTESYQILNISGNFKLHRYASSNDSSSVYSLPGTLPCDACGGPTGLVENGNNNNSLPNAYPNPTKDELTIPYKFNGKDKNGIIFMYDVNGKLIKEYKVDSTFDSLIIETGEFSAGTYFYKLVTSSGTSEGKKIIITK
jgi:hypothetical protein